MNTTEFVLILYSTRWSYFIRCLQVVLTSTNPSEICINGMSFSRRSSRWANAALVINVSSKDFKALNCDGPLAGVEFQVSFGLYFSVAFITMFLVKFFPHFCKSQLTIELNFKTIWASCSPQVSCLTDLP